MSRFVPDKSDMRATLLFLFHLKKNASESHRMLVEAYGEEYALSERACRDWFQRFRNGDFDMNDKPRSGHPKKFQDEELQALLDVDNTLTQKELAKALHVEQSAISERLHAMGKIRKLGKWIPQECENETNN